MPSENSGKKEETR